MGYGLFFALSPLQAQTAIKKFSLELKNESLPEALKQLEKAGGKNILFTYNGTESYRVTVSIREKTEREAIDLVLAGKPFLCIEREEPSPQKAKYMTKKEPPCPLSTFSPLPPIPVSLPEA